MNFLKHLKEGFEHILKLDDPPHKVALGFSIGIFSAFTPFLGFHIIIAILFALILRTGIRVAVLGTLVCNPWTMPFIYGGSLFIGNKLVNSESKVTLNYVLNFAYDFQGALFALDMETLKSLFHNFLIIAKPFAIGTLALGSFFSIVSYLTVFIILKNIRNKKPVPNNARD